MSIRSNYELSETLLEKWICRWFKGTSS